MASINMVWPFQRVNRPGNKINVATSGIRHACASFNMRSADTFDKSNCKTYRPVAQAIAQALPSDHGCLAERGLSDTQLASLSYFVEIEPVAENSAAGPACNWLLVVGDTRRELAPPSSRWNKVWEGNRPGDRREKFRLYRR